jgi:hypothetical protein
VRLYVGNQSRNYSMTFNLFQVSFMNQVSSAMEPKLAELPPGVYFVALTVVDTSGRESGFSNELRVDTRMSTARSSNPVPAVDVVSAGVHVLWAGLQAGELTGPRA